MKKFAILVPQQLLEMNYQVIDKCQFDNLLILDCFLFSVCRGQQVQEEEKKCLKID
jgi:hypothetical protein